MKLLRRLATPSRQRAGWMALFAGNLTAGLVASLAFLFRVPVAPTIVIQAPPAVTPTPAPFAPYIPIQTHLSPLPRSLGAAAPSPRRYQYENSVTLHQGGQSITMPVHTGTVSTRLGPVVLTLDPGETLVWDPNQDMNAETEVHAVFAWSDRPAETPTAAVLLWGTGLDAPAPADIRTLDPQAYIPETMVLPFHLQNNTSRQAHVTLIVWLNTDPGGQDF